METVLEKEGPISPRVVERYFRDVSADEREQICDALDEKPRTPWDKGRDYLWQRYERGEVGLLVSVEPGTNRLLAASFYEVNDLPWGRKQFAVLSTVSLAPDVNATDNFLPQVEAAARALGCDYISISTVRPGLVRRLVTVHGYRGEEVILGKELR